MTSTSTKRKDCKRSVSPATPNAGTQHHALSTKHYSAMSLETRKCRSGFLAVRVHYSVDPEHWTPKRVATIRAAMPGWRWLKEYEIDFAARGGMKVYDAFDPLVHVCPRAVQPAECLKYKVIDHGRRNPAACLWWAETQHAGPRTVFFYREYYRPDATIAEHCEGIKRLEDKRETRLTLIDPATHRRQDNSLATIADEYARYGIATFPADNNLETGIETVTFALLAALARWSMANGRVHPFLADRAIAAEQLPALASKTAVYFHPSMVNTIREMTQLSWRDSASPDEPLCERIAPGDDHCADCVRYALRRPWTAIHSVNSHIHTERVGQRP